MTDTTRLALLLASIAGSASTALAQTSFTWTGGGDGTSFSMSSNWTPVGVPGALDEAKFDSGITHTVNFSAARTTTTCSVENDNVTFGLGGFTYTTTALIVGDRTTDIGRLTIGGGTVAVGSGLARIGRLDPASGFVTVNSGARLQCANDLLVGDGGDGTLTINVGGTVTCDITFIGDEDTALGTVTNQGSWTIARSALIGNAGDAAVTMSGGGDMIVVFDAKIGDEAGSVASVIVTGTGSTLSMGTLSTVGNAGNGTLDVRSGGVVTANGLRVSNDVAASGAVIVNGASSRINNASLTTIGNVGPGSLTLIAGGTVQTTLLEVTSLGTLTGTGTITGPLTNDGVVRPGNSAGKLTVNGSYTDTGALEIEIGGPTAGVDHDQVAASGAVVLSGDLTATLINGYNPASGSFVIITGSSITGAFAATNLPPDFAVVYEPTRVLLVKGQACEGDCDGDGVCDADEVDCDANGTPDDCEVLADCNHDGEPDECDPNHCAADLAAPFGVLNVFDFLAFQSGFSNADPCADLAAPFGTFNVFDFLSFQTAFGQGC